LIRRDHNSFLQRRKLRIASRELTQMLVLGLGVGALGVCVGAYKFFLVQEADDTFWRGIGWMGVATIVLTLIYPYIWHRLENLIRKFGGWVGHNLMTLVLTAVYFALIWPIGLLLRATKGTHPIYGWSDQLPTKMEGWHRKEFAMDINALLEQHRGQKKHRVGVINVMMFFAQRGHYVMMPVLFTLVALGIALFFLQTSALAPFIYTLF
jgi:hypothetical protein